MAHVTLNSRVASNLSISDICFKVLETGVATLDTRSCSVPSLYGLVISGDTLILSALVVIYHGNC